jgi:integrase
MKPTATPPTGAQITLQHVLDRLADAALTNGRRRDLRSALTTYTKLIGKEPTAIPLDLTEIRHTLDDLVPAEAKVSRKRWANLRSDLAAAIGASGLRTILKTGDLAIDPAWEKLFVGAPQRVSTGLSRLARWASLRRVVPQAVNDEAIRNFISELELSTLVRGLRDLHRSVAQNWNALVGMLPSSKLQMVTVPSFKAAPTRLDLQKLPASFRQDVGAYMAWCEVPDPLDDGARARILAPRTRELRRNQIHSAVTTAVAGGVPIGQLVSLAALVEADVVKALLRYMWKQEGDKLSAYMHGVAGTLVAIAKEWAKMPADKLEILKGLRRKLGSLPSGLTPKNETLLRRFDDPGLLRALIRLPDKLWCDARRLPAGSARAFIAFQNALAIDLLIHAPLRMENLSSLAFDRHLHWPRGPGKPALLVIGADETKSGEKIELEIPAFLADRLLTFRDSIAPKSISHKPTALFVTWVGTSRGQATLSHAITKTVRSRIWVKMTPHQFRHLAAKIFLDRNPGALEVVRQFLGHKNAKTTINFYAGINTRRAGKAHTKLLMELKEQEFAVRSRRRRKKPETDEPETDE